MNKNKNPFSPYRIEFPYTCSSSIPEDGHITQVTIETRSEELRYGGNDKANSIDIYDAEHEMELVELCDCDGVIPDDSFVEHCYIWDFTVEEVQERLYGK